MGVLLTDKAKEEILKETFKKRVGYDLDLENPKSFNEKIMWFKLYYQDPLMTKCCEDVYKRQSECLLLQLKMC